jgi:hypothetical protein
VACKSCGAEKLATFKAEIALHCPGREGLDKPPVWVFPQARVCLNCGNAEFLIPKEELRSLTKEDAAGAG